MTERNYKCPKCDYHMLAISGKNVICLNPACDWNIEAKRKEDGKLPLLSELRENWQ